MKVTLTVIAGPHLGREFAFEEHSSFIAGRSRKVQFQLPQKDQYFSRVHFLIELNPPLCRIVDLESSNGTFVNGREIRAAMLKAGDLVEAGDTVIRVDISHAQEDILADSSSPAESRTDSIVATTLSLPPSSASPICPVTPTTQLLPADYREWIAKNPQPIAGYSIVDELGRGGMGIVYRAVCHADQSVVALKTILPAVTVTPIQFQKFRREALILRNLDHPRIVRFRDVGESGDMIYFVMDYVPGVDGRKLQRRKNEPLPVDRSVRIVCQLLHALEHAHGLGYVHRDIKPANLLIQEIGGRDFVWLTDFGLARTYHSSQISGLTMTGDVGGTTPFMPPEQITEFRESPPAVDQYAAAATLYRFLTNANVYDFPKEAARQLLMVLTESTVPIDRRRGDLPTGLVNAIHKALSREPEDRFSNVTEFRNAIERFTPS